MYKKQSQDLFTFARESERLISCHSFKCKNSDAIKIVGENTKSNAQLTNQEQ